MHGTVVIIGRVPCESSEGCIAAGEYVRVPLVEALTLAAANLVTLADWHEQQEPIPRGWYQRRDLRASR